MYGKSTGNQRIEAWWSILRRQCTDVWIYRFKTIVSTGRINLDDPVHVQCLRLCFLPLIDRDLKRIAQEWNTHRINARKQEGQVAGKPDKMFFLPEKFDAIDKSCEFQCDNIRTIERALHEETDDIQMIEPAFIRLVNLLQPGWRKPETYEEGLILLCNLIIKIRRRS